MDKGLESPCLYGRCLRFYFGWRFIAFFYLFKITPANMSKTNELKEHSSIRYHLSEIIQQMYLHAENEDAT